MVVTKHPLTKRDTTGHLAMLNPALRTEVSMLNYSYTNNTPDHSIRVNWDAIDQVKQLEHEIKQNQMKQQRTQSIIFETKLKMISGQWEPGGKRYHKAMKKINAIKEGLIREASELENSLQQALSYVDVMPDWKVRERENVLSPDEVYSLRTGGYRRSEEKLQSLMRIGPPPAKRDMDSEQLDIHKPGPPMTGVYKDRLNSDERFEDYLRGKALKGLEELNRTLESA